MSAAVRALVDAPTHAIKVRPDSHALRLTAADTAWKQWYNGEEYVEVADSRKVETVA